MIPDLGPSSRWFTSQRLRLHYADWGNETAPLLILLHGGRDHCRSWDWTARQLRDRWHIVTPDLRGHGDSTWSPDGDYCTATFVHDLAQLIHHLGDETVSIVAHSLGGQIALRYAGLYPDKVRRLVIIEGLGLSPSSQTERTQLSFITHWRRWIADKRAAAGRTPKRYPTITDAYARMKEANSYLTEEQAVHLTTHGTTRNEDGSWSWKFDNYLHLLPFFPDLSQVDIEALWKAISCPTLLLHGADSWASNPEQDGSLSFFSNAKTIEFSQAGHWLHHDRFAHFIDELDKFL